MKPLVSVIMSIYNESLTQINDSINSIIRQTLTNFEFIIICDNPKRKDVRGIVESFADNRIIFSENEHNIGLAMSMNKAANLANSEILARMDADDISEPERLKTEYRILNEKKIDLVFSSFTLIDDEGLPIQKESPFATDLSGPELSRMIALNPSCIHHPTVMMRRNLFDFVKCYRDFPCSQDADLWMRLQEAGCLFYRCGESLLRYRINSQSVSRKKWFKQRLTWYYIFNLSLERIKTGKDSYSLEHYNLFLQKNNINSQTAESQLRKGYYYLGKAKRSQGMIRWFYRLLAFSKCKLLRENYKAKKEKEKLISVI